MFEQFQNFITDNRSDVESALRERLPLSSLPSARRLNDALEYALFPGGKRLRPVLSLLASSLVDLPRAESLTVACAMEFLHGSSLVVDDLPGMDDACLRRNKLALHLAFGEGVAMLAALALLNQSYALFAEAARLRGRDGAVERLIQEASTAIGAEGMIGGQLLDLQPADKSSDTDCLAGRELKTVALTRLMMTAGAIAHGADDADTAALAEFGESFGRAYQICDDIMDCASDSYFTGKTSRQDARHGRLNAVDVLGQDFAHHEAYEAVQRGVSALVKRFGHRWETDLLADAAYYTISRAPKEIKTKSIPPGTLATPETAGVID